jgi:CheY-like chemotaxis protein
MDYRMKTMNGLEAAKQIHVPDPSIKIVIASADDAIGPEAKSARWTFLQKPFSLAQLERLLSAPGT